MNYFLTSNCALEHNKLFCVEAYSGVLIVMDSKEGKSDCYNIMEGFVPKKVRLIDFLDICERKVYALDSAGCYLVVFDLDKYCCQYIWLGCGEKTKINFAALERYGSQFYIFPKYGNKVLVFDTEKRKVTERHEYLDGIEEIQCTCRGENSVWILPKDTERIYRYHLPDMQMKAYDLKAILRSCVHAIFKDGHIYILEKSGIVYKWDIEKEQLDTIEVLKTKCDEKESMSRIIYAGNKLILLPAYANDIKILDLMTNKVEVYNEYPKDLFYYETNWLKYYGYCEDETYYYFAMCAGNYTLMIKKQSGELRWMKPIKDNLGEKVIRLLNTSGENLFHEGSLELTDLLKANVVISFSNDGGNIGRAIYEKG